MTSDTYNRPCFNILLMILIQLDQVRKRSGFLTEVFANIIQLEPIESI